MCVRFPLCWLFLFILFLPAIARGKVSDEDVDEEEMQQIKAALRQQALQRLLALRDRMQPPLPAPGFLARISEWLPRLSLVGELRLAYDTRAAQAPSAERSAQTLEVGLQKAVDGYFRLDAFATFNPHGAALLEAYATTLFLPFRLQLRGGLFLHRFGLTNDWHAHAFALWGRPAATAMMFGPEGGGGLGLEGSWLLPLPWSVEVLLTVMEAGGALGVGFYGDHGPDAASGPLDLLYVMSMKHFVRPGRGVSLFTGLSLALGPNATGRDNRTDVYGADVLLRHDPGGRLALRLALLSEWFYRRRQVPGFVLQDLSGYVEVHAGLLSHLLLAARYEYRSGAGPDTSDPAALFPFYRPGPQVTHRAGLALNYALSRYSLVQLSGLVDLMPAGDAISASRYAGFLRLLLFLDQKGTPCHSAHTCPF